MHEAGSEGNLDIDSLSYTPDLKGATLQLRYRNNPTIEFRGVDVTGTDEAAKSVKCEATPPTGTRMVLGPDSHFDLEPRTTWISCNRSPQRSQDGREFFGPVRLAFKTQQGRIVLDMPPLTLVQVDQSDLNRLSDELTKVRSDIAKMSTPHSMTFSEPLEEYCAAMQLGVNDCARNKFFLARGSCNESSQIVGVSCGLTNFGANARLIDNHISSANAGICVWAVDGMPDLRRRERLRYCASKEKQSHQSKSGRCSQRRRPVIATLREAVTPRRGVKVRESGAGASEGARLSESMGNKPCLAASFFCT
jgi:hypothetical protein